MAGFENIYTSLNKRQRLAVDSIEGPLLVLAGPGTGKTQLLSARVANILRRTDTLPENILCLTFTESGARNMRDRLNSMIGSDSYDVHISTYHSFGSDIIRQYPQYFTHLDVETGKDTRLEKPIDDLTKIQIIEQLITKLPYDDPLKGAQYYIKSVVATISELKKSLIRPDQLAAIANDNIQQIENLSPAIEITYGAAGRMPSKASEAIILFATVHEALHEYGTGLAHIASAELETALEAADMSGKTNTLTAWKNSWLQKDENGKWNFSDREASLRVLSLAKLYDQYNQALANQSLYDFDDMILKSIEALKSHADLLYNLQERYQYVLLDEFQDTNTAQFELVRLLASHLVNEGRPNIMAVGDDDQAIYAFQGAEVGNMLAFVEAFRDVSIVNLTDNYRSHSDILHVAHALAGQIESRLHYKLQDINKSLTAVSQSLPVTATIERHEFNAQASEYSWIAHQIDRLIKNGVSPESITVLSPKHARLETLVPFLNKLDIPVSYEKRENILDARLVRYLELTATLLLAVNQNDTGKINELFPIVLSLDFWQIPTESVWRVNWQLYKDERQDTHTMWPEIALTDPNLREPVLFLLRLGTTATHTPLEYILDHMTGSTPFNLGDDQSYTSPLKDFYFSAPTREKSKLRYYETISHLSVIRSKLREYQTGSETILTLADFLRFIEMYKAADQPLINSHPIAQADSAVQLMTVYKAKGLEFDHVFLLSLHDDIWGKKARNNSNKIGLPPNLRHIRYFGSGEDELKRLLFVAVTRAKHGLYLTSHSHTDSGKATEPVKYLLETEEVGVRQVGILPASAAQVLRTTTVDLSPEETVELLWQERHVTLEPPLKSLLSERLINYRMSPTHLNTYIDIEYGGPEAFLLRTLLRFPQAPEPDGEYGNAIHGTLDWIQKQVKNTLQPTLKDITNEYDRQLKKRYISSNLMDEYRRRGHNALNSYYTNNKQLLYKVVESEVDFSWEGVLLNDRAHLSGKIDRLEVDKQAKTIKIVDFKTGEPSAKWESSLKLLKYRQQLYFYKLLIEGSHTYKGYRVLSGRLEFVEPNASGRAAAPLVIEYADTETEELRRLILVVWERIQSLELDDISLYSQDYKGAKAFIQKLLGE